MMQPSSQVTHDQNIHMPSITKLGRRHSCQKLVTSLHTFLRDGGVPTPCSHIDLASTIQTASGLTLGSCYTTELQ